eukprot:m.173373 g.173373  ORF g.173373 m.173373 type:complete len:528 (-) comp15387_c0_seq1:1842-3425(-)
MAAGGVVLSVLVAVRCIGALLAHITDCDETFNYWEPLHYLLHGTGLQTWEYSPEYGLRSYAYLFPYGIPSVALRFFSVENKVLAFYLTRALAGTFCAYCESVLYIAIKKSKHFGPKIANVLLVFLIFGAGMYHASPAFIPSTTAMYFAMLATANWISGNDALAIWFTAANAIVVWPFSAALGIPIAIDCVLLRFKFFDFMKSSIAALICILTPTMLIDGYFYGKPVFAAANIVFYNVLSQNTSSELYGTEPLSFYFQNLFLNFNVASLLAILSPLVLVILPGRSIRAKMIMYLSPLFIWMAVFFPQAHKEERFLFPVYPFICLAAASSLCVGTEQLAKITSAAWWQSLLNMGSKVTLGIYILLSLSRSAALYKAYYAPMPVYASLANLNVEGNVCLGKEWHRYPGSFFLPPSAKFQFIKSEFAGLLPKPFGLGGTSVIPTEMNNMNLEEPSRYIAVDQCQYMVDQDRPVETELEPRFKQKTDEWEAIFCHPFLESSTSHPFFRAFYVPTLSEAKCHYNDYCLLKAKK